ncbi:hypothetical protein VHEMI08451 [[Torrubiella] hemipterigena]|uniref:Uncharacterized protein n=1 Tax=[Torrubiella] hemipterigena TaxID=1531966 RepID=A0A0A1T6S7_9HYPO|nr:hypothetical protein VHEMI08451 [[Torrubiella] hemipterigena]
MVSSIALASVLLTTALPAAAIELPKECQLPNPVITDFRWFNSSFSLRCFGSHRYTRGYYCWNGTLANPWLEPSSHNDCIESKHGLWAYVCAEWDIPQTPPPWGHGPAESLPFTYQDG